VQRNLIRGIRQLHPDAQDKGVNEAKFVVLRGATMPSVLTEISFLTNEHEAALLSTDVYLDQISDALLDSILDYQQTLPLPVRVSADGND
jgi:N-acetylmuramoyl-L-alanine amidase